MHTLSLHDALPICFDEIERDQKTAGKKEKGFFLKKFFYFNRNIINLHPRLEKVQRSLKCENSSVGRASPCQGGGRGFESRFSLNVDSAQSPRVEFFFLHTSPARVVELVDTPDLKSCGHYARAGSSPASSTEKLRKLYVYGVFCCNTVNN